MLYKFFQELTNEEGETFFKFFLEEYRKKFEMMIPDMRQAGIDINYRLSSLRGIFEWLAPKLSTELVSLEGEPEWIIRCAGKEMEDFNFASRDLIYRVAYYFGECFLRESSKLKWAVGGPDSMEHNSPVIRGFLYDMEFCTMVVSEVLCTKLVIRKKDSLEIDKVIEYWKALIPKEDAY